MLFPQAEKDLRDKAQKTVVEHVQVCSGDSDCITCKLLRRGFLSAQAEMDQELHKYYRQS